MRNLLQKINDAIRRYFEPIAENIPGLDGSRVLLSVPKNVGAWTGDEWYAEFARKNEAAIKKGEDARSAALCPYPGCEGHMLEGPSGGMAINIKCDSCDRKWNLISAIQRMERI